MKGDYRIGVNGLCPKCGRRLTTTYCMNCSTGVRAYDRGDGLLVAHKDYLSLLDSARADIAALEAERDELRRRLDAVVAMLHDARLIYPQPDNFVLELHYRAVAIAEGRTK